MEFCQKNRGVRAPGFCFRIWLADNGELVFAFFEDGWSVYNGVFIGDFVAINGDGAGFDESASLRPGWGEAGTDEIVYEASAKRAHWENLRSALNVSVRESGRFVKQFF